MYNGTCNLTIVFKTKTSKSDHIFKIKTSHVPGIKSLHIPLVNTVQHGSRAKSLWDQNYWRWALELRGEPIISKDADSYSVLLK